MALSKEKREGEFSDHKLQSQYIYLCLQYVIVLKKAIASNINKMTKIPIAEIKPNIKKKFLQT